MQEVRPGKWLYILAIIMFVGALAGGALSGFMIYKTAADTVKNWNEVKVTKTINFTEKGEYSIYQDSILDKSVYIVGEDSDKEIELKKVNDNTEITIENRKLREVYTFNIDKPGKYVVLGDDVIVSKKINLGSYAVFGILIVVSVIVGALAFIMFILAIILRSVSKSRIRRMQQQQQMHY